jgi:hypothetical protein
MLAPPLRWRGAPACAHGPLDVRTAVGAFGGEAIVRSAKQPQVFGFGAAAFAGRVAMIDLQPGGAAAASAIGIDPATAEPIPFEHGTSRRASNVRGRSGDDAGW